MKIVHLGYKHSPKDIRIFYKECTSLVNEGYDVTYITSSQAIGKLNSDLNNVKVVTIEVAKGSRITRYLTYLRDLYNISIKQNADVYHVHEPLLMYVGLKLKKKNKKIIFDSHENYEGYWDNLFLVPKIIRKPISRIIWRWLIRSIKRADGVISATPFIAEQLLKYNVESIIVNNYPLLNDIKCENEYYEEREKIICFAGAISNSNGINNVIKAIEEVEGKFFIAGSLPEVEKEEYEKMEGWKKTNYVGLLDRDGISELYNKCVAGIVTDMPTGNNIEGLPIKMFEFMIAGIPVITSDFLIRKEIILNNDCGLCVDPTKINEIVEAIRFIFENKEKAKKMGTNGQKAVLTKFNWNIEEKKLLNYYSTFKE